MTIQAKALVRLTGIILSLSLFTTIAAKAQAGAGDLGSTESFDINEKSVEIKKGGDYTITGDGQTGNTIKVDLNDGGTANITIEGVDISKAGTSECPFDIIQGTVHLTLAGKDNILQAGDGCAALQVSENSVLVITGDEKGKLKATGGVRGAGIGGGNSSPVGSITIAGGNVDATGGEEAAGIGGGYNSDVGSITIEGGTVTATGGADGAGIGGGSRGEQSRISVGPITISGGTVVATGGSLGAGIGEGSERNDLVSISISGGTVVATGGERGAGIGVNLLSSVGSITISGGKVTTEGNIGAGEYGSVATGKISGGTIVCKSISPAFTISGGSVHTSDKTIMSDNKRMAVVKGLPKEEKVTSIKIGEVTYNWTDVYTDENGMLYLYLQQDQPGSATVTIEGQTYTANASREYNVFNETVEIKAAGDYAIVGGETPTGNTITVELGKKEDVANITIEGVNIGLIGCPFDIKQGVVNLTLEGDNVLKAQRTYSDDTEIRCAALQVSENSVLVITEKSTGTLTATGGYFAAGIGGGASNAFGSIIINGGTLDATGGDSGAGIGGGADCTFGSITIKGGTVNATGGEFGASIGGGMDGSDVFIDISGGKITTKGNIGDGAGGSGATGTISGGTIVCKSISSTLSISGGSVRTDDNSVDKEGNGMAVVKGLLKETKVTSIQIDGKEYGSTDVFTDKDGQLYLYIPQGKPASVSLTIDKTKYDFYVLTSLVVEKKDNVGGYTQTPTRLTITEAGEYTLKGLFALIPDKEKEGKKVSEYAIDYSIVVADNIKDKVTLHLDGVSLTPEIKDVPALSCGSGNTVTVVPDGDNYLEGGYGTAGINKGSDAGTLTIEGPGRLEVKGGSGAAGIGGNDGKQANNIKIAGGTIVASGGVAGIGSGADGSTATNITITGGSVNAKVPDITDKKQTAVTFPAMPGAKVINANVEDLGEYGLPGMNLYLKDSPSTATLYLWLPDGYTNKEITINGYSGKVTAGGSATLEAITIKTNESYNPNTHKDKNIKIAPDVTFTIDAADATVIDLTIEKGGKLLTNKELKVKGGFTVKPLMAEYKWITFCSPVPLNLLYESWATGENDAYPILKSGFTTANDQEWTFKQSIEKDTPYLLAIPFGHVGVTLYAQGVTLPGKNKIDITPPSGFDNNLLFCANTSLTEQELTNIYVLDKYNEKQAIVLKDKYTLKPFEAYFIASPASPTPPAIESQGEPGKVTSPELRSAPLDILMPQKLTLKQPHSGKGSFTVTGDQVAYGFALEGATVTLVLEPKTTDGYSIDNSLIKVYGTNDPNTTAITLSGSGNTRTFTMPNAPVTIEVEFMKELTINPDEGQVVYADEKIEEYHPTYKVEGITEADGNVVFTGNLKVVENNGVFTIDKGDLSAVNYTLKVKEDVTVERLSGNVEEAEATPTEQAMGNNGWHKNPTTSVTLVAPPGFSIKQTSATPALASLSLRDAADADGYTDKLTFTEQGEHTVVYSLKRKATNKEYGGKSITYKLDHSAPAYKITESKMLATVKLTDIASGLSTCSYIWDGGAEQSVTGFTPGDKEVTFTLTGKVGTHTLKLTAIDQAGNKLTEDNIQVELKDHYVPPINPDNGGDDNNGGGNGGGGDDDDDPNDPVANEVISANHSGIYVENGKLCLEASQPCQVMICNYQGGAVMIRQIPSGKTRLYELPAGQYIVSLSAPYLPQGKVVRKVMVR